MSDLNHFMLNSSIDLEPLRSFVRSRVLSGARERDADDRVPLELYEELQRLGWLHSFIPRDLGGLGLVTADLIWIVRELAYGSPGLATGFAANMAALVPILEHGNEAVR